MMRARMKTAESVAAPVPNALNRNMTAASIIVPRRPMRSDRRPATNAPIAQPIRIAPTLRPVPRLESANAASSPACVPLMTPLS
jgi:hypothetical protein